MRFCAAISLVAVLFAAALAAQPPGAQPPPQGDPAIEQTLIAARYRQLEDLLLRIAQKLERSGNPENVKKARVIQRALKDARDRAIAVNLNQLADALKKPGLAELKKAVEQGSAVKLDLEQLLLALLADDENNQDRIKQLTELIKELDVAIRNQKVANAKNQTPSVEAADAAKAQEIAKAQTDKILGKIKAMQGKSGANEQKTGKDAKDAKAEGNEGKAAKDQKDRQDQKGQDPSKDSKGDPKEGQGEPKQGEGQPKDAKDSQKGNEQKGQPGQPGQEGQQGDQQQPQEQQGEPQEGAIPRQKIQDANEHQKRAAEQIKQNQRPQAQPEQDEATRKLEEARKRLEEILRQMREEEIERVLADLQKRCEVMLQMQEIVYDNTKRLFGKIQSLPGHQPTREEEIASRRQSEAEDKIVEEADKAIAVIEAEGSAVAFLETFRQVRGDMALVSRRLNRVDTGQETQVIEEDIIATLKDMIEALKKQQKEQRDRKNQQQQQNGQPPPQSLIDKLAELRMIKALQLRVNNRTKLWAQRYQGEQANDPEIIQELRELAQRQLKIHQVTENVAKGRNQ